MITKHTLRGLALVLLVAALATTDGTAQAPAETDESETPEAAVEGPHGDALAAADATADPIGPGREIVIGAGNVAGAYFPVAGAICRMVSARAGSPRCLVESNANSSANLDRLREGLLDFAIVQSDWLMHAANGTNLFRPAGPDETLRAVLSLHGEPLTLVARADSGIRAAGDLRGKRLNLGTTLTYQRVLTEALLRAFGIDQDDLAIALELPAVEQFSALCAGELDAAATVVAHPSPEIASAIQRCDLRLVPISGEPVERLLKERPELAQATIPGAVYAAAPDPVPSFGLRAVLATTSQVEDEVVRTVVEAVVGSLPDFRRQHPVLNGLQAASMASAAIAVPLHDAASRYFASAPLKP